MSDLVDRLRGKYANLAMQEAADEIERLRADMTRIAEMDPTIDGAARYMVAIATAALGQKEAADEDWGCAPLTSGEEAAEEGGAEGGGR